MLSLKLLLVGQESPSGTVMKEVLEPKGAEIFVTGNREIALAAVNRQKFDGIFVELPLQADCGVELIQRIRASARNTHTTIVLVGQPKRAFSIAGAFSAGVTLYLARPFERNSLSGALNAMRCLMLQERRRSSRIALSRPAECSVGAREIPDCIVRNLSVSGILLQTDGSVRLHSRVRIAFQPEMGLPLVIGHGMVVRVNESEEAGIRLSWNTREDQERVLQRIAKDVDAL